MIKTNLYFKQLKTRIITFTLMIFLFFGLTVSAQTNSHSKAIGAVLGDPTGFTFKYGLGADRYFDAVLSYNTGPATGLYLRGNYIVESPHFTKINGLFLNWYYGLGGRLYSRTNSKDENKSYFGPEGLLGAGIFTSSIPLEIYLEGALVMNLLPSTSSDIDIGLGVRYWF